MFAFDRTYRDEIRLWMLINASNAGSLLQNRSIHIFAPCRTPQRLGARQPTTLHLARACHERARRHESALVGECLPIQRDLIRMTGDVIFLVIVIKRNKWSSLGRWRSVV